MCICYSLKPLIILQPFSRGMPMTHNLHIPSWFCHNISKNFTVDRILLCGWYYSECYDNAVLMSNLAFNKEFSTKIWKQYLQTESHSLNLLYVDEHCKVKNKNSYLFFFLKLKPFIISLLIQQLIWMKCSRNLRFLSIMKWKWVNCKRNKLKVLYEKLQDYSSYVTLNSTQSHRYN